MQYLIGVDIGTQSTRAAVMEESGRILTQASKETELIYEGDRWVWQEPDRMYGDAVETVKAAVEKARIAPQQVASICMDAQMAGTMGIGKKGEAVTPYDSWLDKRCEDSWEELRAFGEDENYFYYGSARDLCSWAENSLVEKASSGDLSED